MTKNTILIIAASSLLLAGCCTTRHATAWEYQEVDSIAEVNKLATDGWIVAGYSTHGGANNETYRSFLMKRAK